jgi:hypothetical protein
VVLWIITRLGIRFLDGIILIQERHPHQTVVLIILEVEILEAEQMTIEAYQAHQEILTQLARFLRTRYWRKIDSRRRWSVAVDGSCERKHVKS